MKIDLRLNEVTIRSGDANLQKGYETVGGRLFLTDKRLFFKSHAFNVQTGETEIDLSSIVSVKVAWTKFLGVFPIIKNSILVKCKSDDEFSFVVFGQADWIDAILKQTSSSRA